MDARPDSLWPELWEGPHEISSIVIAEFKRKDKERLRGASRSARTAVNATVSKVEIVKEEDLRDLPPLRLEERFPRLASVALRGYPQRPIDTSFTQFALHTLSKLPSLTAMKLSCCKRLENVSACEALLQCPQVEELTLDKGAQACNMGLFML